MEKGSIYIVIINYKNYIDTSECIQSILYQNYQDIKIVVVDNNSQNDSIIKINKKISSNNKLSENIFTQYISHHRKISPHVQIIKNIQKDSIDRNANIFLCQLHENYGFGIANNIAFDFIKPICTKQDYVCFINNDTYVSSRTFTSIIPILEKYKNSIFTCTILYENKKALQIWAQGGYFSKIKATGYHYNIDKNYENNRTYNENDRGIDSISFIPGCFILSPISLLKEKEIKFSKEFFLYGEDLDYSLQCMQAKISLFVFKSSFIFHKVSASHKSSRLLYYYTNRNRFIIANKWLTPLEKTFFIIYIISTRIFLTILHSNTNHLLGIKDGIKHKYGEKIKI